MDKHIYKCKNGKIVNILVDATGEEILIESDDSQSIGNFNFRHIDCIRYCYLLITNMHIEGMGGSFKRQGIGRECIKIARNYSGLPIYADDDDGITKDDGSHLTGDARNFVLKMQDEGLIETNSGEFDE